VNNWLVFAPLVDYTRDVILGLKVVGQVRAVNAEHAIRVAKTKGFLAPIIGDKIVTNSVRVDSSRLLSLGGAGDLSAAPGRAARDFASA
jgi:hypothetical protein